MKKLLFVTDNGFYKKENKFYYSTPNYIFYDILKNNYDQIDFIARNGKNEENYFSCPIEPKIFLINKKDIFSLIKITIKIIKEYDMVLCFGINGFIVSKIASYFKIPVINYVGGSIKDSVKNCESINKKIILYIYEKFLKRNIKNSKYVHYCDKTTMEKYPTRGKYLICSSAYIEYDKKNLDKRLLNLEKNINLSEIKLGIIGAVYNNIKGMDTIIKSLSFLPENIYLEIVGRGDHSWLDKIALEYKVEKRIKFLGVISERKNIFDWLDNIDIYLQPSRTEGLPRATIEAMSRACPVIASVTAGGLKYLIDNEYLIRNQDPKELAKIITKITGNVELIKEQAKINFKKSEEFTQEKRNEKFNKFYGEII